MNDLTDLERRVLLLEEFVRRRETDSKATAYGTYTPTLTNNTNIAASTAFACQYLRVGNVVHVAGRVDIDATAAGGTSTVLDMTLPIASDIASSINLGGVGSNASGASGEIRGEATNNLARFTYPSGTTANSSFFFTFTYLVI